MSEASKMISMEQHCKDLGELEQIISELRRALDNANAASVERHYRAAQPVETRSRCCDAISQKNVCSNCGMVCFERAAQPESTPPTDLKRHLDQALRQWCMYANDNDSRELESCPSAEGEIYREAKK